jgi:hypothetical protein
MTIRMRCLTVASLIGLAFAVGACGDDDSSSSSAATTGAASTTAAATSRTTSRASTTTPANGATTSAAASDELCSARDSLGSSVQDLTSVDVVKNGTSSLQAAVSKVKDNLQTVKAEAGDELRPQVEAMETSLTQLQDAVSNVSSGGIRAVSTALSDVGQTGSALLTSLQSLKCS